MKNSIDIREVVAKNIVRYRKQAGLTQAALAEKIHYSDKAVSKWERGEGLPDVVVLKDIADALDIDIDDMLHEETPKEKFQTFYRNRTVISILSVILVFFVFTIATVICSIIRPDLPNYLLMVYSIPCAFIVALVFNSIWGGRIYNLLIVSGLDWTVAISLVLSLERIPSLESSVWYLYFAAAVFEIMVILWYMIEFQKKKHNKHLYSEEESKEDNESKNPESDPEADISTNNKTGISL